MKRFTKLLLALAALVLTTASFAATTTNTTNVTVSPAEKAKIQAVVRDYLVNNPEVIVEAIQVLQKKQYAEAEQTVKQTQAGIAQFANALLRQANDPVSGNPNGKVTVVEFFDYQCPHCVDMAPTITAIIKANPDVRIVYKDFPIRGPMSEFAARAAIAANLQGKYDVLSHAILTSNQPITQDLVFKLAQDNGLNVEKLKTDMNSKAVTDQLKANVELAKQLKLFGTPALFIGKTDATNNINYVPGQMDQKQLQDMIDKAK
jgi:protein-disulfide isomerase